MRRFRKAKIIATLGPKTSNEKIIEKLVKQGVDVFRINSSHGEHEEHAQTIKNIRNIEKKIDRPLSILLDLQGPKLRIGEFKDGHAKLKKGQVFSLDQQQKPGDNTRVQLPHPEFFKAIKPNKMILLDDGKLKLKVKKTGKTKVETIVQNSYVLSDRKGINIPDVILPISAITKKDMKDLQFGLRHEVDWIGLSFVQKPDDIAEARKLIGRKAGLIAKIEKPSAVDFLDEIIDLSDGLMVARGDLGVEVPPETVPSIQKKIIRRSRRSGKPVIVATQMLDSMTENAAPTRAEASDVATAIYDGTDAVMLSAETAVGNYPLEAVTIMDKIIQEAEKDHFYRQMMDFQLTEPEATAADAITFSAHHVASTISACAIVTFTTSGSTSMRASRVRPEVPILGLTSHLSTARRLALAWGIHSVHTNDVKTFSQLETKATSVSKEHGFAKKNDSIVITAGVPFGTPGATNILRICWV